MSVNNKRHNEENKNVITKKIKINNDINPKRVCRKNKKLNKQTKSVSSSDTSSVSSSDTSSELSSDSSSDSSSDTDNNVDKKINTDVIFDGIIINVFDKIFERITDSINNQDIDNSIKPNNPNKLNNPNIPNTPNKPNRPPVRRRIKRPINNKNTDIKQVDTHDCTSPTCDHKSYDEDPSLPIQINLTLITTLNDLIILGKSFHCKKQTVYKDINLRVMNNLVGPLLELNDMIGMKDVKEHMVNQILFFLQGFNTVAKCDECRDCLYGLPCVRTNNDMMHTVITGPPGVGKTCLGRIMGKIYKSLGILSNGSFFEVTRSDFVAEYLGQTAIKTQKLINMCYGGVMFIDEAYSMGSKEKRDSFAKEALDTLNKNLSDNRNMLCIVAGYEKDLDECFFSINDGLKRRFTFRYNIDEYDYNELLEIFKLKITKEGWSIDYNSDETETKYTESDAINLFRNNKLYFPYSGGDIETFFLHCKIAHSQRLPTKKKCLSYNDINNGLSQFIKNRKANKNKKTDEMHRPTMYKFNK